MAHRNGDMSRPPLLWAARHNMPRAWEKKEEENNKRGRASRYANDDVVDAKMDVDG